MKLKIMIAALFISLFTGLVAVPATSSAAGEPPVYKCTYTLPSGAKATYVCARVTGITKGGWLNLWKAPDYSHGTDPRYSGKINGGRNYYAMVLKCWTTGPSDRDGNGNRYWWRAAFDNGKFHWGYVNDQYLTTGSYATWSKLAKHC